MKQQINVSPPHYKIEQIRILRFTDTKPSELSFMPPLGIKS